MKKTAALSLLSSKLFITLCLIYFLNVLSRNALGPLAPQLAADFHLSHSGMGSFFFLLSLSFGISLFCSQFFSALTSHFIVILSSSLLSSASLFLMGFLPSVLFFRLGLVLLGLGSGLFLPSAIALINATTAPEERGRSFGLFSLFQNTAFIAAPILAGFATSWLTWKALFLGFGCAFLFDSILITSAFKSPDETDTVPPPKVSLNPFQEKNFWKLAMLLALITTLNVGLYCSFPLYFSSKISASTLQHITVISRTICLFSSLLGGFLIDRLGVRWTLIGGLSLCGLFSLLLGIAPASTGVYLILVQAPLAVALTPIIHTVISFQFPKEKTASMISYFAPISYILGAGLVPQLFGICGDLGIYSWGFLALSLVCASMATFFILNPLQEANHSNQEALK